MYVPIDAVVLIIPGRVDETSQRVERGISFHISPVSDGVVLEVHPPLGDYSWAVPLPVNCDVCGFLFADVMPEDVATRLVAASTAVADLLESAPEKATARPGPQRWSNLEYGAHLRDVLISIRERVILATLVDLPTGVALYRDERVAHGLYRDDIAGEVADELRVLTRLFVKTFDSLCAPDLLRPIIFSTLNPMEVSTLWCAAQAVHESEHHLSDVVENLASFA